MSDRDFSLLGIVVEALASFPTKTTSVHIVHQKRAGPVLAVSELLVEYAHDGQTGVKSNEISECEGSHGHVCTKLHCLIDVLCSANSLVEGKDSLIDVWHQDAVRDETWDITRRRARLTHRLSEFNSRLEGCIICLESRNHFNEFHDGHWVHEMHADDLVSAVWNNATDLGNRDGGRVRGKDSMIRDNLRNTLEDNPFDLKILVRCLDHEVCIVE